MLRYALAAWFALATACGAASGPAGASRSPRAELTGRLCELLPARAYDCVVSWPGSVSSRRRAEVMAMSVAGPLAGSDSPVRAYASCQDRATGDGPVARLSVLLLATAPSSRAELEAAIPIGFRWEDEPCVADACALPVARLDDDRLLLTRRDFAPDARAADVARLACLAVSSGAVEAYVTSLTDPVVVRELHADDAGVLVRVRSRGRPDARETRADWAELGLRLVDQEITREAGARASASARVQDLERIDFTNPSAVERQILARERRLARHPSDEHLAELGALLGRAFTARPSRTDLGVRAVERSIEAGDLVRAREALGLLVSLLPSRAPPLPRLQLALALAERSTAATREALSASAPDLGASAIVRVAVALLLERAEQRLDQSATMTLSLAARGLVAIERRERAGLRSRTDRQTITLRGVPATLAVIGGCSEPDAVVVCGRGAPDRAVSRIATATGGTLTSVGRGGCLAGASEPAALTELPHLLALLDGPPRGELDVYVACGDDIVGLGGDRAGSELTVTRVSRRLGAVDLALAERWLARPFGSLDGRVFPAPILTIEVTDDEADGALAATRTVEGARCARVAETIECTGALADAISALYASFAAD